MKFACWFCLFVCGLCATCNAGEFAADSVAGTGAPENNGDAGPSSAINIGEPFGVEIGPDGALYIAEVQNHRVRRLDLRSKELTTVAGCGRRGYSGDGGPATKAELNEPYEIRFDAAGNMYIVEMQNHIVRRIDGKTKTISTFAGTGKKGFGGDGGPATKAQLSNPHSIALDEKAALYVADIGNHRIRRVDPQSGMIESIAGNFEHKLPRDGEAARGNPILGPRALYVSDNTLWIALREGHSIWRMDLAGGILHHVAGTGDAGFAGDDGAPRQAKFNGPKGIAVGPNGNVYIADTENNAIRVIDLKSGKVTTIAASKLAEEAIAGHDPKPAIIRLNRPHGLCVGADGAVYVGDTLNHRIVRVK